MIIINIIIITVWLEAMYLYMICLHVYKETGLLSRLIATYIYVHGTIE